MINERMTFWLKYGKETEAFDLWKSVLEIRPIVNTSREARARMYKPLSGRAHTVVQDFLIKSLNDHNPMMYYWVTSGKVQEIYKQFVELCDSSTREMFKIEHETGNIKDFRNIVSERNAFRLQYGKAKESIALWKEMMDEAALIGGPHLRLMTDVVGPSYSLEVEAFYPDAAEVKTGKNFWDANDKLKALHQKFIPLCVHGERNYFQVQYDM